MNQCIINHNITNKIVNAKGIEVARTTSKQNIAANSDYVIK